MTIDNTNIIYTYCNVYILTVLFMVHTHLHYNTVRPMHSLVQFLSGLLHSFVGDIIHLSIYRIKEFYRLF